MNLPSSGNGFFLVIPIPCVTDTDDDESETNHPQHNQRIYYGSNHLVFLSSLSFTCSSNEWLSNRLVISIHACNSLVGSDGEILTYPIVPSGLRIWRMWGFTVRHPSYTWIASPRHPDYVSDGRTNNMRIPRTDGNSSVESKSTTHRNRQGSMSSW